MLLDSHAHLLSLEDPEGAVSRAAAEGVGKIVSIGTGIESSLATIEFSRKYRGVYVSVGIHPHSASSFSEQAVREIEGMLEDSKVVALGETGLDLHYMKSSREEQIVSFLLWRSSCNGNQTLALQAPRLLNLSAFPPFFLPPVCLNFRPRVG